MTLDLQFHFDFGSPNAYLCMKALPELLDRTGADLVITPCLLGGIFKATGNKAPMVQYADAPAKLAYENLEMRRFIEKHGLTKFRLNPHFPVNTLLIMRGAVAAERLGCAQRYVDTVFASMWERGANMADVPEITAELNAAGLDGAALVAATQDAAVKAELMANTQAAHARGAFGSPIFFVGEEMYFGKDRLGEVEEEIVRAQAA